VSNSKLKCRYCKEYFRREEMITTPAGPFCTDKHAAKYAIALIPKAREKQKKAANKAHNQRKREFQQNDVKIRRPAAKDACHAYIRMRDKDSLCICCNKPLGENYHAGHFLESGNNPLVRYDEDNIHAQRVDCNYFKGGDSGDYEKNLRAKIGDERVDLLLTKKGGTLKRTGQDYAEIEACYKAKIRGME
jgi:hypothetical protein